MLRKITSSELTEWVAMYNLEPWGDARDDFRMGQICSTIANVKRTKSMKALKPDDFFPVFKTQQTRQQTIDEQIAIFKRVAYV